MPLGGREIDNRKRIVSRKRKIRNLGESSTSCSVFAANICCKFQEWSPLAEGFLRVVSDLSPVARGSLNGELESVGRGWEGCAYVELTVNCLPAHRGYRGLYADRTVRIRSY